MFIPGSYYYTAEAMGRGYVYNDTVQNITLHIPAIVTSRGNPKNITGLEDLANPGVKLVLGDPNGPAIGKISKKMLDNAGMWGSLGNNVQTYTLTVTNHGPSDATGMTLTDTLPADVVFVSATSDQGTCVWTEGTVVCNADAVARDTPFAVAITIRSSVMGVATHTAAANSHQEERDSGYYENRYLWTRVCGECVGYMPGGRRIPGHRRRY